MKMLSKIKMISASVLVSLTGSALAGVLVAKHDGSGFKAVSADSVKATCGEKFAFRDEHKKSIPPYLEPALIKMSFSGKKLHSSIDGAKAEASSSGKCIWYTDGEKGALGL